MANRESLRPPKVICVIGYVAPSFDEPLSDNSNETDQFKFSDDSVDQKRKEEFSPLRQSFNKLSSVMENEGPA